MKKVGNKLKLLLIVNLIIVPGILIAQEPFPDNTEDVPFDGGISLLVAAGLGYGLKKVYEKKKEEKNSELFDK